MPKKQDDVPGQIDRRAFGQRVYAARCEAHLQVGDVAGMLDVSEIFVRQIELGKRLPSLTVFVSLCNALRVSPAYLLSGELDLGLTDPVQMAVDLIADCTPRQGEMLMDALAAARRHIE